MLWHRKNLLTENQKGLFLYKEDPLTDQVWPHGEAHVLLKNHASGLEIFPVAAALQPAFIADRESSIPLPESSQKSWNPSGFQEVERDFC